MNFTNEELLSPPEFPNAFGGRDTNQQQPLRSAAGWYIGDLYHDRSMGGYFPYSRDSAQYWATRDEAVEALKSGEWMPRMY